jgi:integrase
MKLSMRSRVRAYLTRRRTLGYKLYREGRHLLNFACYADKTGHRGSLTTALAIRWATLPRSADPAYRARRLDIIRVFARHQAAFEPATQIPPRHVLGPAFRRRAPHLFTVQQLHFLMQRAGRLSGELRPLTYQTLIGLLACTGLRISEALALTVADVDLTEGVLTVRQSKAQHSRQVPFHPSALSQLRRYARRRAERLTQTQSFFVTDQGQPLRYGAVGQVFPALARDIIPNNGRRYVRLHDLRHTFACRVLLKWQRSHRGAVGRVAVLSRYLGHLHPRDTYWYLTAVPQLLKHAAARFDSLP